MQIKVSTKSQQEIIDITKELAKAANGHSGGVFVTVLHTTCAITTAELDPGTDKDFLDFLNGIVPNVNWRHGHNPKHTPAHLLSSLIGPSVVIPVSMGKLQLGTWQRVVLVELDGPRERALGISLLTSKN